MATRKGRAPADVQSKTPDELSEEAEALAALGLVLTDEGVVPRLELEPIEEASPEVAEEAALSAVVAAPEPEEDASESLDPSAERTPPENEPASEGTLSPVGVFSESEAAESAAEDTTAFLKGLVESILFVSDRPLELGELARAARLDKKRTQELLGLLIEETRPRGVRVEEIAGGYVFRSNPAYSANVRQFLQQRPVRLSRAQIETLAIVAYRQPITRPEIDEIRGVDSGPVLKGLLERDLVRIIGKKDEPGRPMLYGTTPAFLEAFSLKNLRDLPTLREYTELTEESRQTFEAETGESAPVGPISESIAAESSAEPSLPPESLGTESGVPESAVVSEGDRVAPEPEADGAPDLESNQDEEAFGDEGDENQEPPEDEGEDDDDDDDEDEEEDEEDEDEDDEDEEDEDDEDEENDEEDDDEDDEEDENDEEAG